jgi:hypothetical protein
MLIYIYLLKACGTASIMDLKSPKDKTIKTTLLTARILVIAAFVLLNACDKVTVEISDPPMTEHQRDIRPRGPVPLGCIRGFFGTNYRTFTQHIEVVQPIDSFSNCYFYGNCNDGVKQINLIRCDSAFILAIYIIGYQLDSLPSQQPVASEFGKFSEIQFYPANSSGGLSPTNYTLDDFYGTSVFITDRTDDILTGTFEGILRSTSGEGLPVTGGEFKLKIFRKQMPCTRQFLHLH